MTTIDAQPPADAAPDPSAAGDPTTDASRPWWSIASPAERVPVVVHERAHDVSLAVAHEIARLIRAKADRGESCVLGLATGSTPMRIYDELVRLHREEGLSFANVTTFNLDEYFPMKPEELQSYHRFMREHLFDHVDIDPAQAHLPDGTLDPDDVRAACDRYEQAIRDAGGIDLQLLGIGRTGHVGFNEPGSRRDSRTRLIALDRVTRKDAASDFFGEEHVPARAITMGVGSILDARRIIMIAFGEGKARIVREAVEGPVTSTIPATFLQEHDHAEVWLDLAAADDLERCRAPWRGHGVEWDETMRRKAVISLARETGKPILKLTNEDYNEHHLQDLLAERGRAYDLNLEVFRHLQKSITGWPGGKRPERGGTGAYPKRILIFSPHPDDDVISMGGTLLRLVEQEHEVHVAYQVSGSIAVFDSTAIRFADFAADWAELFGIEPDRAESIERAMVDALRAKKPGEVDPPEVQKLKALIRRGEAKAATRLCGVPEERLHFLDMPFYETGRVRKKPLGAEDVEIVANLLRSVRPHQVYAAGDLSDPHGTHRTCLDAVFRALDEVAAEPWVAELEGGAGIETWLYRGAWQEWGVEQTEMAVPLSPEELDRKKHAIFAHESQKDRALFPGADEREFWERAEQRNRATAALYDDLGLAEYEAVEAFVRWDGRGLG